ncbi:hypothetical protein, partial [Streptococcus suis]|uniref:hypothetical protein n=1 Tax=Streptococcus suis TaxID=1307 RepID=UPI0012907025
RRPFYFVQMRWFKHQNSYFSLKTVKKTNTKTMFVCNLKLAIASFSFYLIFYQDRLSIVSNHLLLEGVGGRSR